MVELAMLSVFLFILANSLPMMEEDEEPDEDCVELLLKEEAS